MKNQFRNYFILSFFAILFVVVACKKDEVLTPAKSSDKSMSSFAFSSLTPAVSATITGTTVAAMVPFNVDVTSLAPTISVAAKATVSPASGSAQNFTNAVTYTVTAEDGTTAAYSVTVTKGVAPKSSAKDITKFSFTALSPVVDATINATAKTITAVVPVGTDITKLSPTVTLSDKATVSPASGTATDFTKEVNYTVTAEDLSTQVWKVNVVINQPKISTFTPDNGPAGTSVVLNGEGFSDVSTDVKVTINGKNATVTASNFKQITIQIPERAGSGDIVVDVRGKTAKSPFTFKYKFTATSTTLYTYEGSMFQSVAIDPDNETVYASERTYNGISILRPGVAPQFVGLRDNNGVVLTNITGIFLSKTGLGGINDKILFVTSEDKGVYYYTPSSIVQATATSALNAIAAVQTSDAIYNKPTSIVHVSQNPTGNFALNGTVYFACFGNSTIIRSVRKDGVTSSPSIVGAGNGFNTGTVSSANAKFAGPVGIFLKNNLVYVADESNNSIRTIDYENGKVTTLLGTGVGGNVDGNFADVRLKFPANIAVDDNGLIYVTDKGNNSLRVFDTRSQTSQTLLTGLSGPYGLTIDKTGSYLIVGEWNGANNRVLKVAIK